MLALGIEGTAHTLGAGIIRREDGDCRILSNVIDMFRPASGGIHPREAANHHAEVAGDVIARALADAGIHASDLDLVAFSRAPGLGPCLRTAATAARAFAAAAGKPLVGVNHCIAHLEIGRAMTPADDPVLLYASGGNTQIIAFTEGRYRVFGETHDVGVGNMLDKFARECGIPFPGGPEVEKLARGGTKLLDLPYTIKGMDVAFSGLLTAALSHVKKGERMEDVCRSIQEVAFSMLVEVTERALAHTEKSEVVLGGGVACNERLFEMTRAMCEARGAKAYRPEKKLLVDNGAMIALCGAVQHEAGAKGDEFDARIDQRQRTDEVPATWRVERRNAFHGLTAEGYRGAEAIVVPLDYHGRSAVSKIRPPRPWRDRALDATIRAQRVRAEAKLSSEARRAGVRTPLVYDADPDGGALVFERLEGEQLKERLDRADPAEARSLLSGLGSAVARLHAAGVLHGDLTTSNVIVGGDGLALVDFGLASLGREPEELGTDLQVLREALGATHARLPGAFDAFLDGYRAGGGAKAVEEKLSEIERRGRYRGT